MSFTGGGCEMNWLLWDPHPKCWHGRLLAGTAGIYKPWLFQTCPQRSCPLQDIYNPSIRIYSKTSGRCLTRTCTWTCFWKGNRIVKCLVPTSQQQCLHILNRCVESSSFKWNLNHLSMSSLLTSYRQLWSFPLAGQAQPHKFIPGVSRSWAVISSLLYHNIWLQREVY